MIHAKKDHTLPSEIALGQLLVERGYLVLATNNNHEVGDVVYGTAYGEMVDQPCYVIGESSHEEFESWCKRLSELTGWPDPPNRNRVATD